MVPRIILIALLALSLPAAASGSSWFGSSWFRDWWDNVYQQRIEKEQYRKLKEREKSRCEYKIEWYTKQVQENPRSDYFQYKLDDWKRRCSVDQKTPLAHLLKIGDTAPMSSMFLTNPDNPNSSKKKENIFWDHKEKTIAEFIELGVPLRPAELAVIDLRTLLYIAQKNKLSPRQTAEMMLPEVERLYKKDDETWRHSQVFKAPVAQRLERRSLKSCVAGSTPAWGAIFISNGMKKLMTFSLLGFFVAATVGYYTLTDTNENPFADPEDQSNAAFTFTEDDIPEHMDPNLLVGVQKIEATVIYSSDEIDLWNCRKQENPESRKGFYLARINNTDRMVMFCGTKYGVGQVVKIENEEGI